MQRWGLAHFLIIFVSLLIVALGCKYLPKAQKKTQDIVFWVLAGLEVLVVLVRFAVIFQDGVAMYFARILLQVCNTNWIWLPLFLLTKSDIIKHYVLFIQGVSALLVYFFFYDFLNTTNVYDFQTWTFWVYHLIPICLPVWSLCCGRWKLNVKALWPVLLIGLLYIYFVTLADQWLIDQGMITAEQSFTYSHSPQGVGILEIFYQLLPVPGIYLVPAALLYIAFAALICFVERLVRVNLEERKIKADQRKVHSKRKTH